MTKTAVHALFRRHRRADEIDRALALLEAAEHVAIENRSTGGRPSTAVRLLSLTSLNSHPEDTETAENECEIREESVLIGSENFLGAGEKSEVSEESREADWLAHVDNLIDGEEDQPLTGVTATRVADNAHSLDLDSEQLAYIDSIAGDEEAA